MTIPIKCPTCARKLNAPDRLAGKEGKCPHCETRFPIPAAEKLEDEDSGTEYTISNEPAPTRPSEVFPKLPAPQPEIPGNWGAPLAPPGRTPPRPAPLSRLPRGAPAGSQPTLPGVPGGAKPNPYQAPSPSFDPSRLPQSTSPASLPAPSTRIKTWPSGLRRTESWIKTRSSKPCLEGVFPAPTWGEIRGHPGSTPC